MSLLIYDIYIYIYHKTVIIYIWYSLACKCIHKVYCVYKLSYRWVNIKHFYRRYPVWFLAAKVQVTFDNFQSSSSLNILKFPIIVFLMEDDFTRKTFYQEVVVYNFKVVHYLFWNLHFFCKQSSKSYILSQRKEQLNFKGNN